MGTESLLRRIDDPHFLISHFAQVFCKCFHIPIHVGLHDIVEGKYTALFQNPEAIQKQCLPVSKTTETAFVLLERTYCNIRIGG